MVRRCVGGIDPAGFHRVDRLQNLIDLYEDPARPYLSRTAPQFVKTYASDYDHLARVYEWSAGDEDGGE